MVANLFEVTNKMVKGNKSLRLFRQNSFFNDEARYFLLYKGTEEQASPYIRLFVTGCNFWMSAI